MRGGIRKEIVGGMQKKKKEDYFQVIIYMGFPKLLIEGKSQKI